jgi:hypothetical protein
MAKNKNYYIAVTAEVMLKNNSNAIINGYLQLKPGCDKVWLENELIKICSEKTGRTPEEIIIVSLSEISRGLYNRLTNKN